jgi:hypothetical protein
MVHPDHHFHGGDHVPAAPVSYHGDGKLQREHIKKAMWRFPAYLFLINLFVLPIAMGGLLLNNGTHGPG